MLYRVSYPRPVTFEELLERLRREAIFQGKQAKKDIEITANHHRMMINHLAATLRDNAESFPLVDSLYNCAKDIAEGTRL